MNKLQRLISRLEKHHKRKIDLSLDRTFRLLKKLGNPQNKLQNVVNIVGTNAKASMAYSLKSILNKSGYKCNLYTSPHLQSFTERFIFDDKEVKKDLLIDLLNEIENILGEDKASLFEILTCAFLKYAENFKDNINIIEAGLFFQFDSTNVFKSNLMTMIGVIHTDHLQWLKNKTIDGIIYEKTSKLLNSNIFVNKQMNEEIRSKIENSLSKNSSNKYFFGKDFNITKVENNFVHYQDDNGEILLPEPNLLGEHQLYNVSTSIAASRKIFNVKDEHIKSGITNVQLKGRLQELKSGKLKDISGQNRIIVDGGHNESSSISISNWIKQQNQDVHLICGMMKDKEHYEFVKHFKDVVKSVTLIDIPNQKGSISKEEFKKKLDNLNINIKLSESIMDAIRANSKYQNSICLFAGSLYMVGEILNFN